MEIAPVLLIVFNRPELTQRVFVKIRKAMPKKLYIAADGPRVNNLEDEINCKNVLDIVNNVDWHCELHKNFSENNLGCGRRPSSAIDWVLQYEDRVIIIEDDCLPSNAFLNYASELLERYKEDKRIMQIAGTRYLADLKFNDDSYFFSRYQRPWGWATWKRAWELFDFEMKSYNIILEKNYFDYIFNKYESNYWKDIFNKTILSHSIWDYQWQYAMFINNGLCIIPQRNLITNMGDNIGTHLSGHKGFFWQSIDENFTITQHPDVIIRNIAYDERRFQEFHGKSKIPIRIMNKIKSIFAHHKNQMKIVF